MKPYLLGLLTCFWLSSAHAQYSTSYSTITYLNHYIAGLYDVEFTVEESEFEGEVTSFVPCPDNSDCDSRSVIQINYGGTAAGISERDFFEIRPGGSSPDGFRHNTSRLGVWSPTGKSYTIAMKLIRYSSDTLIPSDERPLDGRGFRTELYLEMEFENHFSTVSGTFESKIFRFDFELDGPEPEPTIISRGSFSGSRSGIDSF